MKIALTIDSFVEGQGGVSTAVAALARSLQRRGHQVRIYTAADQIHRQGNLEVIGLRALHYERFPGGRAPLDPVSLMQGLADYKPDVIHNHSMSVMGMQTLAAARLLGIPTLATCHVYLAGFLRYAPVSLEGLPLTEEAAWRYTVTFFNRFPYVTTPSRAMQQALSRHGLSVPVVVVSNGVDIELFRPRPVGSAHELQPITILHVGRLGFEKRVDIVLRAFARLAPTSPSARLVIAGDGPQALTLQSLARDLGIAHRVNFTGQVSRGQLPNLYRQADIFVTASTIETQGLVVLEAMASGLPIVGVKAMALPELIRPAVNGFMAEPGDEKAFSEAIVQLLISEELRQRMGHSSRQMVFQHSLHRVAGIYETLYEDLLQQARPGWLSYIPSIPQPALVWSFLQHKGYALKNTGHEFALRSLKAIHPLTQQIQDWLIEQRR